MRRRLSDKDKDRRVADKDRRLVRRSSSKRKDKENGGVDQTGGQVHPDRGGKMDGGEGDGYSLREERLPRGRGIKIG